MVYATNDSGAFVNITENMTVTDNLDPSPVVTNNAPAGYVFSIGTTNVTWIATDWANNSNSAIQLVMVYQPPPSPTPELSTSILTVTGLIGLLCIVIVTRRNQKY